ncbi:cytochrome c biogenesis CcdA family protein [Cereibacter sp. SYSU M97828]|nr:cytochrome c biogenesis CcdA family protein [Cereibacter flavus]
MPVSLGFAFVAGLLTIAAPCILPMLPILLGASIGKRSRLRPLFIVLGFVLAFSAFTLVFSFFTRLAGLSALDLRLGSAVLIGVFGIFMLWPAPMERLTARLPSLAGGGGGKGLGGAMVLGAGLGLVWAPCAGPVLASILVFVATSPDWASSLVLLLAYALGCAIPMLLIAYGGQAATTRVRALSRHTHTLQRVFGVLMILSAAAIWTGYDTILVSRLTALYPQGRAGL